MIMGWEIAGVKIYMYKYIYSVTHYSKHTWAASSLYLGYFCVWRLNGVWQWLWNHMVNRIPVFVVPFHISIKVSLAA